MASPLQQAGAVAEQSKWAPLHVNRMMTGLWTQRNPLREAAVPYLYEKFYSGSRNDSVIGGLNAELGARLTWRRRPGLSVYNSQSFAGINRFYEFRTFTGASETIRVMADTAANVYDATGPNTKTSILTKSAGAGPTFFLGVGNELYLGNGVDQKKWLPGNAAGNWGGSAPASAPNSQPLAAFAAPCRYWGPGMVPQANYTILDDNGNIQLLTNNQASAKYNTTQVRATVVTNGVVPATLPVSVSGASPAVNPFTNATLAGDGDPNTAATAVFQHTNAIGVCVWGFTYAGAAPVSIVLNVLSGATAPVMNGSPCTIGVWYSTNGGTTWTPLWSENVPNVRASQWLAATIPAATATGNILVCAYIEAHDDAGIQVPDLNLLIGTNTIPTASTGDKSVGSKTPNWNTELYGLTVDGNAIWQNMGPPSQWLSNKVYSTDGPSAAVIDPNGNLQVVQTTGVSGASQTAINGGAGWAAAAGSTSTDGTVVWLNCGPGITVATKGWTWAYAYHFPDGHVTTLSPVSQSSGPVLGKVQVLLSGLGCPDATCDAIWLFRTLDGSGAAATDGGSTLLFDASFANPGVGVTWSYTDIASDDDLNELIQGAMADQNDPPPVGLINLEYHMSRIWGSVGNTVYYSRTPNALAGSPLQSFPPSNYFVFPSRVVRIWSSTTGLLVFTTSGIYPILGRGTTSDPFYAPGKYDDSPGLLHYDAFAVNGSTPYMMTSAHKLVAIDPGAGFTEPGFPIGDQLETFDPVKSYVAWHEATSGDTGLFVADGSTGWYRMASLAPPETGVAWSTFAQIAGGCSAVQSIETAPGVHDLLVGPAATGRDAYGNVTGGAGVILRRDRTKNTDNNALYAWHVDIGSLVLAQPGQVAELGFITVDSVRVGTRPTISTLLGEISGAFESLSRTRQDPPLLPPSKSLFNDRYSFSANQRATYCRHFQIRFSWKAEDAAHELLAYTVFGALHSEKHR